MVGRRTDEGHRASTPLELFFDLCFVVAVNKASSSLHHGLVTDDVAHSLFLYPAVFFAIWWAWMNFTWFASAYDNDDDGFRLATFVQIAGSLILAAGVPRAFSDDDFVMVTIGYTVMRLAMVGQWLRAARDDPIGRPAALRYAAGVSVCQVGWIVRLALPRPWDRVGFLVLIAAELLVPIWAERARRTPWHPTHIAERYGLFTLIVLSEAIFAATTAVQTAFDAEGPVGNLGSLALGALVTVFAMWWLYFDQPAQQLTKFARERFDAASSRQAFTWGYGHYVIFASAAAVGAGIETVVDGLIGHTDLGDIATAAAVAVPVALYLISVWALHAPARSASRRDTAVLFLGTAAVLLCVVLPDPVPAIGVVTALTVGYTAVSARRSVSEQLKADDSRAVDESDGRT
jgi:low temperature requirement protein LtrA